MDRQNEHDARQTPDPESPPEGAPASESARPVEDAHPAAPGSARSGEDTNPAASGSARPVEDANPAAPEGDPGTAAESPSPPPLPDDGAAAQSESTVPPPLPEDGAAAQSDPIAPPPLPEEDASAGSGSDPSAEPGAEAETAIDPAATATLEGEPFADHDYAGRPDPASSEAPAGDATAPPKEPGDAEATPTETALAETPAESTEAAPDEPPPGPGEPARTADPDPDAVEVSVVEVRDLNWNAVRAAVASPISGERAESILTRMEERLADGGPVGLAFEEFAASREDQAIQVGEEWPLGDVWFVGDLHGDLLALEAALQHVESGAGATGARIVFLGDLFDDGAHSAEVVLRIFQLVLDGPMRATIVAGNHDEALSRKGGRFQSTVLPSDFTDWLNTQSEAGHPWAERLGRVIIHFFRRAPRALFFPDGLLVAHGGIPHTDLHPVLEAEGNWNDPRVLQDFVWLRAHPRARKRIPNRTTRGSEFGREDFAAFCDVATRMGRPVSRMLRGHDHVEERFAVFPKWNEHPALTINTLSHKLPREVFGPYERVPVIARWVRGRLPEVRRLFIPPELIREVYPEPMAAEGAAEAAG